MRSIRRATQRAVAAGIAFASVFLLATCDLDKIVGAKADSTIAVDSTELILSFTGASTPGVLVLGSKTTLGVTSSTVDLKGVTKRYYSANTAAISIDSISGQMTAKALSPSVKVTAKILAPELGSGVTSSQNVAVRYKAIKIITPTVQDSIQGLLQTRTVTVQGTNNGDTLQAGALTLDSLKSRDATIFTVAGSTITARKGGTAKLDAYFGALRDSISIRVRQVAKSVTFVGTNYVARHLNFNIIVPLTVKDVADSVIPNPTLTWRTSDTTVATVGATTGLLKVKKIDTTAFVFAKMDSVERSQRITVQQVVGSFTKTAGDARSDTIAKAVTVVPTVTAFDSGGVIVKGATVVFRTASSGNGALVTDTLQVTDVNGVAKPTAWKLKDSTGANTLTATSGAQNTTFTVTGIPGRPFKLAFSVQPASAAIGAAIAPAIKVSILDSLNNVVTGATNSITLSFSNNPGGATLGGGVTQSAVAGVATFSNITVSAGGLGYVLQAASAGVSNAVSNGFDAFGAATKLGILNTPSGTVVSVPVSPSVRVAVQDAAGATVTSATNTITLSFSNPAGGTVTCSCTVAAVAGIATFTPTFNSSGTWTGTATATPLTSATGNAFTVSTVGTASKLAFAQQPSDATAGVSITPAITVRVLDANGALVTTSSQSVTLAIDPTTGTSGASLSGTTVSASAGVATFSSTSINRTGTGYKLNATGGTLTSTASNTFNINTGIANKLGFAQQPTNTVAGSPMSPGVIVEVQDASGNRVTTGSSFSVTLSLSGCSSTLSGGTALSTTAGVATFINLSVATQVTGCTLVASATGILSGTSTAFNSISATGPQRLRFTSQPTTPSTAGSSMFGGTVTIQDVNGNNVTSTSSVSITLSVLSGPSTTITGTTTSSTTTSLSFNFLTFATAGTYRLLASATGFRPDTSGVLVINPGSATKLGFLAQPTNSTAGVPFSPVVSVAIQDINGNTVTTASSQITLTTSNGNGFGSGTTVVLTPTSGVATFTGLTVKKAATSMSITASASLLSSAFSNSFAITAAPLSTLGFSVQPNTVTAGSAFSLTIQVQAQDSVGNAVTDFTSPITVALTGGTAGAVLSGTKTVVASAGVSNFPGLTIDKSGTLYQLNASASGLTNAVSNTFTVNAGTASKLGWITPAAATTFLNAPLGAAGATAQVAVQDVLGNTVTSNFSTVRITVNTGPSATFKSFGGSVTFADIGASSGVASLPAANVMMSTTGTYTLLASSPFNGYTQSVSASFGVNAFDVKAKLAWSVQPNAGTYNARFATSPVVSISDAYDNLVTSATDALSVAIGVDGNAPTTLSGTGITGVGTLNAVAGLATFADITLNRAGTGYTLVASGTVLTQATSNSFTTTSPGIIVPSTVFINDMVRLGNTIYFTHSNALKSVSTTGGTVTTIVGSASATRVITDGTNIYWAELNTNSGDAVIKKLVPPSTITTLVGGLTNLALSGSKLYTDGTNVYFTARNQAATGAAVKSISVNANNGTPTDLISAGTVAQIPYFHLNGGFIYFYDNPGGVIKRMTTTGASLTTLTNGGSSAQYYAMSGNNLFFNDAGGLNIRSIANANSIGSPVTPTLLTTAASAIYDLGIDGSNFYHQSGATIRRNPLGDFLNFTAITTSADQFQHSMAFDGIDLYFNDNSGRIAKLPK